MLVKQAKFVTSAAAEHQFLRPEKPMIAVCGKSNAGKSTLINMLAGQKRLAKTSAAPGRTRLVNYFDYGEFILADLPGYGFARVSKAEKQKWARLLDDFFSEKESIAHVFALADIRHDPTADDRQMVDYLYYHLVPFTVIATKADKLSKAQQANGVTKIAAVYKCGKDNVIATSAQTRQGLEQILEVIEKVLLHGEEDA